MKIKKAAALTTVIVYCCIQLACGARNFELPHGLAGFDVSPQGQIVYAYNEKKYSSLYIVSQKDPSPLRILRVNNGIEVSSPVYCGDGDKIIFARRSVGRFGSDLCVLSVVDENVVVLLKTDMTITSIDYDADKKIVRFVAARVFGGGSPIASNRLHGFDVYSYKIADGDLKKLSNIDAVEMRSISVMDGNRSILSMTSRDGDGLYIIDEIGRLASLPMSFQPEMDRSLYFAVDYSIRMGLACFASPGAMHIVDVNLAKVRTFYTPKDRFDPSFIKFYGEGRILFSRWGAEYALSVDINGDNLKKIVLSPSH